VYINYTIIITVMPVLIYSIAREVIVTVLSLPAFFAFHGNVSSMQDDNTIYDVLMKITLSSIDPDLFMTMRIMTRPCSRSTGCCTPRFFKGYYDRMKK